MYALYYLYEWNFLRTQAKMEMTLSKNNTLLVVIGNGLKSRRIYCYSGYQSHAPFNDFFGIHYLHNIIMHLFNPPKILHTHCLQFLLGHEHVLRVI